MDTIDQIKYAGTKYVQAFQLTKKLQLYLNKT